MYRVINPGGFTYTPKPTVDTVEEAVEYLQARMNGEGKTAAAQALHQDGKTTVLVSVQYTDGWAHTREFTLEEAMSSYQAAGSDRPAQGD